MVIQKDSIAKWTISWFLLYMLWFQYAVTTGALVMPICGCFLCVYIFTKNKPLSFYRSIKPIFAFFLCCLFSSLVSDEYPFDVDMFGKMIKYSIPMIAICAYVDRDEEKLISILWVISVSCALVALSLLINGKVTVTGATTLGTLNVNVLSSYLMLGLISNLLLLTRDISKNKKKILAIFIIIQALAQFLAASRRGILIFVFLCGAYILMDLRVRPNSVNKVLNYFILFFSAVFVGLIFADKLWTKIGSSLFALRFMGTAETIAGDGLRASYQQVARELFFSSPLIGKGLNVVAKNAGSYAHSMYYETLACAGVIGMLCILNFFLKAVNSCMKICQIADDSVMITSNCSMIIWSIMAILLTGVTVVLIYDSVFYILIAVIAASLGVTEKEVSGGINK